MMNSMRPVRNDFKNALKEDIVDMFFLAVAYDGLVKIEVNILGWVNRVNSELPYQQFNGLYWYLLQFGL